MSTTKTLISELIYDEQFGALPDSPHFESHRQAASVANVLKNILSRVRQYAPEYEDRISAILTPEIDLLEERASGFYRLYLDQILELPVKSLLSENSLSPYL